VSGEIRPRGWNDFIRHRNEVHIDGTDGARDDCRAVAEHQQAQCRHENGAGDGLV
jgi:hypothetical protein